MNNIISKIFRTFIFILYITTIYKPVPHKVHQSEHQNLALILIHLMQYFKVPCKMYVMNDLKSILGIIATILVFIGYIPYLRDIVKGKTRPHIYSWFLWCFVTLIAFALQITGGAGTGALVTLAAALMCIAVIILGFKYKAKVKIIKIDTIFLILALVALGLWLIAKQPVLSAILTTLVDLLGFAPTIRKSWNKPFTETLTFYYLNTFRFGLAVIALQKYSIITTLYPTTWLAANSLFALMLITRRKQVSRE